MAEFLFYTKFDFMLSLSMLVYSTCLMILLYSNNFNNERANDWKMTVVWWLEE